MYLKALSWARRRRGFTGHEHIRQFNIINMNARLYDPRIGRFFSPDNYITESENPQSYNRYSYALNNPLKYTDPTGNFYYGSGGNFKEPFFPATVQKYERPNSHPRLAVFFSTTFDALDNIMSSTKPNYGGGGGKGGPGNGTAPKDPEKEEEKKEGEKDPEKKEGEEEGEPRTARAAYFNYIPIGKNFIGADGHAMCLWFSLTVAIQNMYGIDPPFDINEVSEDPNHAKADLDGLVGSREEEDLCYPIEDRIRNTFNAKEVLFHSFDIWNDIGAELNRGSQIMMNIPSGGTEHSILIHDITVYSQDRFTIGYYDCNSRIPVIQHMNQDQFVNYESKAKTGVWGWLLQPK